MSTTSGRGIPESLAAANRPLRVEARVAAPWREFDLWKLMAATMTGDTRAE